MAKKKATAVPSEAPEVKATKKGTRVVKAKAALKAPISPVVVKGAAKGKKVIDPATVVVKAPPKRKNAAAEKEKPKKAEPKSPKASKRGKAAAPVDEPVKTSPAKAKKAPAKKASAAKETVTKTVKQPKPKKSPVKSNRKTPAVPKVATPEKKTSKVKKAAATEAKDQGADSGSASNEEESQGEETKKPSGESGQTRKRAKAVKEVVISKKPKIEVTIPFRQQRGVGLALTMGQGDVGQLGLGEDVLEKNRPALVNQIKDLVDVYAGGMHTVCLTSSGEVWTFGCNDEGALGRDTSREGSEFEPGSVSLPGKCVHISAGDSHTAALLEDGRVFLWGTFRDSHGTMGLNSSGSQKLPVSILEGLPVQKIASGSDHLVCLTHDGHVYTCGCAEQGQLGRVAEVFSNRGGRKGKDYLLTPQLVAFGRGKKNVIADDIWTGSYCTFVRAKETGAIYVFGLNNYNQLGLPSQDTRFQPEVSLGFQDHKWSSISAGQHHTLALDVDGKVYCIGRKEYGRLGLGDDCVDVVIPTLVPALQGKKCVEVAAGEAVSFAVTESGIAYSWGMGTNGQLGLGNDDDVTVPTTIKGKQLENRLVLAASAGGQHTVLLVKDVAQTDSSSSSTAK